MEGNILQRMDKAKVKGEGEGHVSPAAFLGYRAYVLDTA